VGRGVDGRAAQRAGGGGGREVLHRAAPCLACPTSGGTQPAPTVLSLDRFAESGIEPTPAQVARPSDALGDALEVIVEAMVDAGWDVGCATHLVRVLAQTPMHYANRAKVMVGWRPIAADLGLPPWRVRRTMVLLLGSQAGMGCSLASAAKVPDLRGCGGRCGSAVDRGGVDASTAQGRRVGA